MNQALRFINNGIDNLCIQLIFLVRLTVPEIVILLYIVDFAKKDTKIAKNFLHENKSTYLRLNTPMFK